jgi:hypothetical protein
MASSIYVYDNLKEYIKYNKDNLNELVKSSKIVDLYIHDKTKLWVVTNTNDLKERPLLQKSLVHFRNGNVNEYKTDQSKLILHDKIKFNPKKMQIDIFPKFLRKPELRWRVDRYINSSNNKKSKIIDYDHRFYDLETDRLSFMLKD